MNYLLQHRSKLITAILAMLLIFTFVLPLDTFAQDPTAGDGTAETRNPQKGISSNVTLGTYIGNALLWISSSVTWLGGTIMSVSFERLVIGMGDQTMLGGPIGGAINDMWRIIRDICNLAFIFGFIYAGITIIVKGNDMVTKRMLSQIIIGALLINFSLFFVKLIVDVGNYVAVEIWNVLAGGTGNISVKIADLMGITTMYDFQRVAGGDFTNVTAAGNFAFYFMAAMFLIVAGFVFAAGGILIIIRFVMLIFYMIFSPILFAATVFPSTASVAGEMWKKVINYSLFAPAFLLLILASIRILEIFTINVRGQNAWSTSFSSGGQVTAPGVFLNFIVIILFLVFSLQIATKFGVAGGERAMSMVNSARTRGQKMLTNTALFAPRMAAKPFQVVARNSVGYTSKKALKVFDKWQAKDPQKQHWTGKAARGAVALTGIDRDIRSGLESGTKVKMGTAYTYKEAKDSDDERKKRLAKNLEYQKFESNFAEEKLELLKIPQDKLSEDDKKTRIALERAVADASTGYLEELTHDQRLAVVELMTQSQIDALNKSDKLTDVEKRELGEARTKLFKEKYGNSATTGSEEELKVLREKRDTLGKANADQLTALGTDFLIEENHAVRLTGSQMDDLKKKLTPTEYSRIDDARKAALQKLAKDGATIDGKTAQNHILRMKASDMSKLPKEVLIALAPQLPVSTLTEIRRQSTLNVEDQQEILKRMKADINDIPIPEGMTGEEFTNELIKKQEAVDAWIKDSPYGREFGK